MSSNIEFKVDTPRILELLATQIYDSPYAMLRENLQNAYDAILERYFKNDILEDGGYIQIEIINDMISIKDNGIGMTEEVVRNHFWNAGSSGKNSDRARNAGVVGSFGIGAIANFGVCESLTVRTRYFESTEVCYSHTSLNDISIGKDCIQFKKEIDDNFEIGTIIEVKIQHDHLISEQVAIDYIQPYVKFLSVPVKINGKLISKKKFEDEFNENAGYIHNLSSEHKEKGAYAGDFHVRANKNGSVSVICSNLSKNGKKISGKIYLSQNQNNIFCFRSSFGLATTAVIGHYNFGGYANLLSIIPTAGREAISRESIIDINTFVNIAELASSELISKRAFADDNTSFVRWVYYNKRYDLVDNLKIKCYPYDKDIKLCDIKDDDHYNKYYYLGCNQSIIDTHNNENTLLVIPSSSSFRRELQIQYLNKCQIGPAPENPFVKIIDNNIIDIHDLRILIKLRSILSDDYFLADCEVQLAEISYGVTILPKKENEKLIIYISTESSYLSEPKNILETSPEIFEDYMKDFVRMYIYPKIQEFVPSAAKSGVESLRRQLKKNIDLYKYRENELGDISDILGNPSEILEKVKRGEIDVKDILSGKSEILKPQPQKLSPQNVGQIENVFNGIEKENFVDAQVQNQIRSDELVSKPPIDRRNISTDKKMLVTESEYPILNNFFFFLGLSDRLMRRDQDFFYGPHYTRIIWAKHRIVYIFTDEYSKSNLYYDIDLLKPIRHNADYGTSLPTTTIITKDRIFVPIPNQLIDDFKIEADSKEFFVHYDIIYSE